MTENADRDVVTDFGNEWSRFDQSDLSAAEHQSIFNEYFAIFPWNRLPPNAVGFDLGCGSGRWAVLVAKHAEVGHLHCIDPSRALEVAKRNLSDAKNASFHQATVDEIPLADGSMDFGYSLGVLHHVPDTQLGLDACVRKLKPGAPFLLYLYYAFDNQPMWFRGIWRVSDVIRRGTSALPAPLKHAVSDVIAVTVYWPLARLSAGLEKLGMKVHSVPLSNYKDKSFYSMRTDALDRFGTRLEQRFTQAEMRVMMQKSGLDNISFSQTMPFWCAVGFKK